MEKLIKTDPSLATKLLQYLNSAGFGVRHRIESIKHALVLLGIMPLKKWVSMVSMSYLGRDKPDELMVNSLVRAKFCETVSEVLSLMDRQLDLFMMGLLSVLDAMVGRPMDELLIPLPLQSDIKATLTCHETSLSNLYALTLACEQVNRPEVLRLSRLLGVDVQHTDQAYRDSVCWADQVSPV